MKDCPGAWADLMPADAGVGSALGYGGIGVLAGAFGANDALWMPLGEDVGQASGIVGELAAEVLNGVAHTRTIPQFYLLSRDNYQPRTSN